MIRNDQWLRAMGSKIIDPFVAKQVKETEDGPCISFGVSSYGYDCRLAPEFKIFTNVHNCIVDPKAFDDKAFVSSEGMQCIIPPNSFVLGRSLEWIRVPRSEMVLCIGKSTYARCGIVCNVTPLEPEWEGFITIEISNTTPLPAKVYAYEGIVQLLFMTGGNCESSYGDRHGKYMRQSEITLPRV